eukprot:SAG11_NODE_21581_length_422_cov_1.445820_1_plen_59_part_10
MASVGFLLATFERSEGATYVGGYRRGDVRPCPRPARCVSAFGLERVRSQSGRTAALQNH